MNLLALQNHEIKKYMPFYGIILNKTPYQSNLILSILTPNLGLVQALLRIPSSKKSKIPPIYYQQLNLIEGIIKKPFKPQHHHVLQELSMTHSFFSEINPGLQWVMINMLNKMFRHFHIQSNVEHYKLFMITLKLLETVSIVKNNSISELLCLSVLLKSILITKVDTSILYCCQCKVKMFQESNMKLFDVTQYFGFDTNVKRFLCYDCVNKKRSHQHQLSAQESYLSLAILLSTLENLEEMLHYYEKEFITIYKIFDYYIYDILNYRWNEMIDKKNNPFL